MKVLRRKIELGFACFWVGKMGFQPLGPVFANNNDKTKMDLSKT
jgi:hypothetical protein